MNARKSSSVAVRVDEIASPEGPTPDASNEQALQNAIGPQAVPSSQNLLRLEVLREIPDDDALRRQWNALVERLDEPQVFYTYEWALAVQRAYGETLRPLVFLAYDQSGLLCGVAALATNSVETEISFLCATTGDYCDFVSSGYERKAFVGLVLAALKTLNVREIRLANLPADSATNLALRQACAAHSYRNFSRTAYVCARVKLAELERRGQNKPVLPRKKMLRRFLNAMGREAPVRLEHARTANDIQAVLPEFAEAHIARFLITGRISNLARKQRRQFLGELGSLLSDNGWIALTRMMSGEKAFAWNYGFQFHGTWFWYQPTFDSALEKYSPGFCLLAKVIEEAADLPEFRTVDLGLGAEDYKDRFANGSRETLYVTLHTSWRRHLREILRYTLAATIKTQPFAEKTVRSFATRAQSLRQRVRDVGPGKTFQWLFQRACSALGGKDEVFFYEFTNVDPALLEKSGVFLEPITLSLLASAAVQYENDDATLAYLIRCAQHLRHDHWQGYALMNGEGEFLHFTWAGPFESFHWSELNSKLKPPAPDSVVLFDSWTPVAQRGKGFYSPTIAKVADRICKEGKRSWGFSASTNLSSVKGLEKAGFPKRFSVVRYRTLWWQKVIQQQLWQTGATG